MNHRTIIRGLVAWALLAWMAIAGAGQAAFTRQAFDKAVAAGTPVIVFVHAPWCPTCRAQKPIVDALLREPKRKDVTLFVADFDTETALRKQLGVAHQSTFVVFKGGKEVGRSTAQTDRAAIAALFDRVL